MVLPQSNDEAKTYLNSLGLSVANVRQSSLMYAGVRATPTILLIDKTGIVTDVWVGRLDSQREADVLSRFQ